MGIEIIGKLTQKNNGDFKLVDLEDVDYDGTGKNAKQELEKKIEEAKNSSTPYDDSVIKADIQTLKDNEVTLVKDETSMEGIKDNEYPTLTTTDKTLIGSINEVNTQCKDIANQQPTDLSLDSTTNLLQLVNSNGEKIGNGITLPISSGGGTNQYLHIKYSSTGAPQLAGQMSDTPNAYIGLSVDTNADSPTNPKNYTWYKWKGDNGDTGATPNLQIGTVTTLESGSSATASITGAVDSPLLNLGIPKGADGASGTGGSSEKEWTLIKSDTLQEECSSVVITADSNGNPFSLNEILIVIKKIVLSGATEPTHFEVVVNDVNLVRATQAIHNSQLRNLECKISSFADYKIASLIRHSEATGISPESFGLYSNKIQGKITKIEFKKYLYNDCKLASGLQYEVYGK